MSEINAVHLINQMQSMTSQIQGIKSESGNQPFNAVLQNALDQMNGLTQHADNLKSRFELGDPNVSLSEVMIASQKERLGSYAALTVRNKLVQSYQEIMSMSV